MQRRLWRNQSLIWSYMGIGPYVRFQHSLCVWWACLGEPGHTPNIMGRARPFHDIKVWGLGSRFHNFLWQIMFNTLILVIIWMHGHHQKNMSYMWSINDIICYPNPCCSLLINCVIMFVTWHFSWKIWRCCLLLNTITQFGDPSSNSQYPSVTHPW